MDDVVVTGVLVDPFDEGPGEAQVAQAVAKQEDAVTACGGLGEGRRGIWGGNGIDAGNIDGEALLDEGFGDLGHDGAGSALGGIEGWDDVEDAHEVMRWRYGAGVWEWLGASGEWSVGEGETGRKMGGSKKGELGTTNFTEGTNGSGGPVLR